MNSLLSAKNGAGRRMEWHAPMIAQAFAARYTLADSRTHRVEVCMLMEAIV